MRELLRPGGQRHRIPWHAPVAPGPITTAVQAPGSKSATNRALVLAALATGPSRISGALESRDTSLMRAGLEGLGTEFTVEPHPRYDALDRLRVAPPPQFVAGSDIDCGLSGTVMRFLPPVAALAAGATRFHGDRQAEARPLGVLLQALIDLGGKVDHPTGLPFTIVSTGALEGGEVTVDSSSSSQFLSGLLMIGARCRRGLTIRHIGNPVPSRPHVDMTLTMLQDRNVDATESERDVWHVAPGTIRPLDETIEPDLTNQATFMAAVGVTGGRATFEWPSASTQAGEQILATLRAFGLTCTFHPGGSTESRVEVSASGLVGADVDLRDVSELTCTAAALAALATGPSRIRGVAHIRGHETDRLAALATELGALGAGVAQSDDGLIIEPAPLSGRAFRTYADHRMAHAGALIGLVVPGIVLDDVGCTTKTLPDFPGMWHRMLAVA